MSRQIDSKYAPSDKIAERIRSYFDSQSTLDQQKESLDRLTLLIFQMEVRYISKLVANKYKSDADLDTELLANHVTFEFLDRYLNCHGREMLARLKVEPLLKKMARSIVSNAVRHSRRWCRNPEQDRGDGTRVVQTEFGSRSEDSMSATAIVRIRNPEVENPDDDLRVLCTLPEGQRIDSTLSKLSSGIYRITIEIPKSISKKYSADSIELCMAFKTTRLDEVLRGNARFTW